MTMQSQNATVSLLNVSKQKPVYTDLSFYKYEFIVINIEKPCYHLTENTVFLLLTLFGVRHMRKKWLFVMKILRSIWNENYGERMGLLNVKAPGTQQ